MNNYDVKRFMLALTIQAEIEAMKASNTERRSMDNPVPYTARDFWNKAEELRDLAYKYDEQL